MFFPDADIEDPSVSGPGKAVCAACPVRDECLDYALERRQDDGIWGGMTPKERYNLRRRRRRAELIAAGAPPRRRSRAKGAHRASWIVRVQVAGERRYLGTFPDEESASAAADQFRAAAEKEFLDNDPPRRAVRCS